MGGWVFIGDLIRELVEALGISRFFLFGHSYGGGLALLAAYALEETRGLILVNSMALRRHKGLVYSPFVFRCFFKARQLGIFRKYTYATLTRMYEELGFLRYVEISEAMFDLHLAWISSIHFSDLRRVAPRLKCGTLMISNADDPLIENEHGFTLMRRLNHAKLRHHIHLAKGGHHLGREKAATIARAIHTFVQQT